MKDKITWKNEKRKVSDLKPFPGNPRKADEKQAEDLGKSLDRFSLADPLVINTDGTVVGGNFRLRLLTQKGIEEADVRVPSRALTREEANELNLRLNKNQGSWDIEELANFSEEMLKDVGWGGDELDEIFGLDEASEFNEKEELEKAVKAPKGVKTGDLWQLGNHRLIIGDSTDRNNWEKVMGEEKFDFMFTDPPYRLAYCKKRVRKVHTKEGWKIKRQREYDKVGQTDKSGKPMGFGMKGKRTYEGIVERGVPEFNEWLSLADEYQNQKGANVMIFESWKNTHDLWEAIEKYWKIMNMVIWYVPNRMQGFSSKNHFFNKFDIAPIAGDGIMNEINEEEMENYINEKGQKLLDSYEISLYGQKGKGNYSQGAKHSKFWKITDHVTWSAASAASTGQNVVFGAKPVQILVPYIKILSPREGIIMEPFGGSGSTIIASEIMKRKCRAIEISPTYGEVIISRFEKFTGKKAEKVA